MASEPHDSVRTATASPQRRDLERALPPTLTLVDGPDPSAVGRLRPLGAELTLGREQGDLMLDDALLSRRHATLRRVGTGPGYAVEDHSKNGTFVDGARVTEATRAAPGSVIRVGATLLYLDRGRLPPPPIPDDPELVGRAVAHLEVLHSVRTVASTTLSVLIFGETGTGKELVARRIHESSRRGGPMVAVNCAALPATLVESALFGHRRGAFTGATADSPGYFRAADRGTLFLDEIGELPLELQPKLLRALETGRVTPVGATTPVATDVRVVAATHVDLRTAVADERFRMDLYARLAGFVVRVPALRHRRDDIPRLVRHLLRALAPGVSVGWEPQWMEALMLHGWPMNVRELRTVLQRAILLADDPGRLHASDLPEEVRTPAGGASGPTAAGGAPDTSLAPTRELLVHLLTLYRGNVVQIARHVGKNRTQVYRWLRRHDLAPDDYRDAEPASAEADPPE